MADYTLKKTGAEIDELLDQIGTNTDAIEEINNSLTNNPYVATIGPGAEYTEFDITITTTRSKVVFLFWGASNNSPTIGVCVANNLNETFGYATIDGTTSALTVSSEYNSGIYTVHITLKKWGWYIVQCLYPISIEGVS